MLPGCWAELAWRGERAVTRPESGPGSIASFGARILAFIVDGILADLIAIIITGGYHSNDRQSLTSYAAFLLIELAFIALAGQTPGMRVAGIVVIRENGGGRAPLQWVLLRTFLLATLVPALIPDRTGRCMHDRAAGTVMLRTR
jgi:uncharacterized RDD family membrane protein YckC